MNLNVNNPTRKWATADEWKKTLVNSGVYNEHQAEIFGLRNSIAERVALNLMYVCPDDIYDTNTVAAGAAMPSVINFFNVPYGTGGKTYAQTNVRTANQLSDNNMAWVMGISLQPLFNLFPIDAANLHSLCHAEVLFKENLFVRGPLAQFPGGSAPEITAVSNLGTAVAAGGLGPVTSYSNGVPNVHNVYGLMEDGYLLWKNDSFNINFVTDTGFNLTTTALGGTGLTMKSILHILRVRELAQ